MLMIDTYSTVPYRTFTVTDLFFPLLHPLFFFFFLLCCSTGILQLHPSFGAAVRFLPGLPVTLVVSFGFFVFFPDKISSGTPKLYHSQSFFCVVVTTDRHIDFLL